MISMLIGMIACVLYSTSESVTGRMANMQTMERIAFFSVLFGVIEAVIIISLSLLLDLCA